ncbi:hypothetical protein CYMTET_32019, partial [Cymbomonas tetramitiformis]
FSLLPLHLGCALRAFHAGSLSSPCSWAVLLVPPLPTDCCEINSQCRVISVVGLQSSSSSRSAASLDGSSLSLTFMLLHVLQSSGGNAALIDAEHAFDPVYAESLGVNVDDLIMCQPDNGEMALEVVDQLVRSMAVDLVCVDSVAALVPTAEIEGEIGMITVGSQARLMSQALRKLTTNASKCNCSVLFINQLRHKIGVMYGSPEVTTGGNALKFYASVRTDIRRIARIKGSDEDDVGIRVRVKVVKNKVARPHRQTELDLMFGTGFSALGSLLECAEEFGLVQKKGSWYSYGEQRMGQGREQAVNFLQENPEECGKLDEEVRQKIMAHSMRTWMPMTNSPSSPKWDSFLAMSNFHFFAH